MESTLIHGINPQEILGLLDELKKQIEELKRELEPKRPTEYLTRNEVAEMLKCDLSTIHNWCKKGKLIPYGIGNRVYFKRSDIELALKQL